MSMPNRIILPILALLSFLLPLPARAQAPVLVWGMQRGCERLPDVDRLLEKRLGTPTQSVALLQTPDGKSLPACQGPACADVLRRTCPSAAGRLLGGQVVQGRDVTEFRLWLYDLATGQIAYQDDYNQSLGFSDAFVVQAKALLDSPHFGTVPGEKPAYCIQAFASASGAWAGPLFLTVYGEGKHKTPLYGALHDQLEKLGHSPLPVSIESKTFTSDVMQKIVAGQKNARVLGAELKRDGKVELFLYDQTTDLTTDKTINCPNCDRDGLIVQTKDAVSSLLEHCFGLQCAGTSHPPPEACEPLPAAQCPGLEAMLNPAMASAIEQDHLTPGTAKLLKGLSWGVFAATTGTAGLLFALNGSVTTDINGQAYNHILTPGAWALTGAAALSLACAIPLTLRVNHAQHPQKGSPTSGSGTTNAIQCPR